jgi:hypothetical protein
METDHKVEMEKQLAQWPYYIAVCLGLLALMFGASAKIWWLVVIGLLICVFGYGGNPNRKKRVGHDSHYGGSSSSDFTSASRRDGDDAGDKSDTESNDTSDGGGDGGSDGGGDGGGD